MDPAIHIDMSATNKAKLGNAATVALKYWFMIEFLTRLTIGA